MIATDLYLPAPFWFSTAALTMTEIIHDAASEIFGMVITIPKTGTLHSFEFQVRGMTTSPTNGTRLSFQDIDVATGRGDGSDDQFCDIVATLVANTWHAPPGPLTDDGTGGGVKRSVTAGQRIACVIKRAPTDVAGNFAIACISYNPATPDNQYIYNNTTKFNAAPSIALKYDDGTYAILPGGIGPFQTFTALTIGTGTTPDECGNVFQVPFDCVVDGVWAHCGPTNDTEIILYDTNGTSVLATATLENTVKMNNIGMFVTYFDAPATLGAGANYRVVFKPSSASTLSIYGRTVASNALLVCLPLGINCFRTERTDAGSWTPTNTEIMDMGLHISQIDAIAAGVGGSGVNRAALPSGLSALG